MAKAANRDLHREYCLGLIARRNSMQKRKSSSSELSSSKLSPLISAQREFRQQSSSRNFVAVITATASSR